MKKLRDMNNAEIDKLMKTLVMKSLNLVEADNEDEVCCICDLSTVIDGYEVCIDAYMPYYGNKSVCGLAFSFDLCVMLPEDEQTEDCSLIPCPAHVIEECKPAIDAVVAKLRTEYEGELAFERENDAYWACERESASAESAWLGYHTL